jgi:hypothetical protein
MNLSKGMQKRFIDEIDFVIGQMRRSSDASTKIYFFSAVHGMAQRIMNMEFNPELAFIHNILNAAFATINGRLAILSQGQERGVGIPDKLFDRLEEALEEMVANIRRGENTYPVLEKISNLAYSTTGNGYYLYSKGLLVV